MPRRSPKRPSGSSPAAGPWPTTPSTTEIDAGDRIVEINSEPVELYKILKFEGLAVSGAQAKTAVASGAVRVNGEVETRKRKQINSGDTIEYRSVKLDVVLASAES